MIAKATRSKHFISRAASLACQCRATAIATLVVTGIALSGVAQAQSSGGLKLGTSTEEPDTGVLDLGATAAPADKTSEAPAASSAPSAASAPSAPAAPSVSPRNAEGVQVVTVGAWEVACPPSGSGCVMAQVGNDAAGTPVLEMIIRKLDEPLEVGERSAIAVLDVITPLGVVLTEGLSVTIDGGREESAPFQICTEQGCLVREPIDDDLISRLKKGNTAVVGVIAANQGPVKSSLSLSGFTKAYNDLK